MFLFSVTKVHCGAQLERFHMRRGQDWSCTTISSSARGDTMTTLVKVMFYFKVSPQMPFLLSLLLSRCHCGHVWHDTNCPIHHHQSRSGKSDFPIDTREEKQKRPVWQQSPLPSSPLLSSFGKSGGNNKKRNIFPVLQLWRAYHQPRAVVQLLRRQSVLCICFLYQFLDLKRRTAPNSDLMIIYDTELGRLRCLSLDRGCHW